ncbi:MAG: DUF6804 family protein [Armatimonadota bacterium]
MDIQRLLERRPHLIPSLIASVLLLVALAHLPYGAYRFVHIITCVAATFVAYHAYKRQQSWAVWAFVVVAVLFNPLVPVHLTRDIWQVCDVLAATMFVIGVIIKPLEIE